MVEMRKDNTKTRQTMMTKKQKFKLNDEIQKR